MKHQQEDAMTLMREVLQGELFALEAESYKLVEDFREQRCEIFLAVTDSRAGERLPIEGVGVGLVDAVFDGIRSRFAPEYPSLKSLTFASFNLTGLMSSGHDALTDAEARVEVGVKNSYGKSFTFEATSRSLAQACIDVILRAIEYFVNSERAFIAMYKARKHYESERRTDLVTKYTGLMSRMVANTSYSEVIERLKSEI